eukprot:TRINITY_DN10491_c0_g1_i1.p1 TRINITY_DN10491_c0_g1~~TRINITY_DN10491_c0_g1_i1.p1  ORF type:complete len:249 (+),score=61.19 TRINITY_DN10491_c0_g1_i1:65-811(+)
MCIRDRKIYFVVMSNVFHTGREIHERFDLKGSTYGRLTITDDPSVAKKDLNVIQSNFFLNLTEADARDLEQRIKADADFFAENNIIDYSLLLGVHYLDRPPPANQKTNRGEVDNNKARSPKPLDEATFDFNQGRQSEHRSLPPAELLELEEGAILSADRKAIYFMAIIDVLTVFNAKKKAEYVLRRIVQGPTISAVPAQQYALRFNEFIKSRIRTFNGTPHLAKSYDKIKMPTLTCCLLYTSPSPRDS